jgi:DNA mismatch endonuclease, patch repair protein
MARKRRLRLIVDEATSRRMAGIRQKHTTPELTVRRALTRLGLRYRVDNRDLTGSPDVANRFRRWVVFVHGCYWHRHTGCARTTTPSRNREFWVSKFDANVERDARSVRALSAQGFTIAVVWECETEVEDDRLDDLIRRRLGLSHRVR